MKISTNTLHWMRRSMAIGLVAIACGHAATAAAQDRSEKLRRYEADRQACLNGQSSQTMEACLKEAKAALDERPGATPALSTAQLQSNAMARCEALAGDERTACVARIRGEGSVSGSVAGGGILREIVITEPVKPAPTGTGK